MSDENVVDEEDKAVEKAKHQALKEQCKLLGIDFHPATGAKKLAEMIEAFKAEKNGEEAPETPAEPEKETAPEPEKATDPEPEVKKAAPAPPKHRRRVDETPGQKKTRLRKAATRLVRVRITCMNPNKRDWPGEIISVGNRSIGTVKKFIPFNAEEGYHVPQVLLDFLEAREFQTFVSVKVGNKGQTVKRGKLVKEFAIQRLPELTDEEVKELARKQSMAGGLEE